MIHNFFLKNFVIPTAARKKKKEEKITQIEMTNGDDKSIPLPGEHANGEHNLQFDFFLRIIKSRFLIHCGNKINNLASAFGVRQIRARRLIRARARVTVSRGDRAGEERR